MRGLFITFEGVDGCGKSTQMRFLSETLKEMGHDLVLTREPGGTPISEKIREILLSVEHSEMLGKTEALLYAAARAQHVAQVILPAVEAGKIVLCDRFVDSSIAYQGLGRELGIDKIWAINDFATGGVQPDKTFFLDFPPQLAFKRMNEKKVHDRLETQDEAFYQKLYDGFVALSEKWPERILRIDASGDKFQTREIVREKMMKILERSGLER